MVASINTGSLLSAKPLDVAGAVQKGNETAQSEMQTDTMRQEFSDQQVIKDLASVPGTDFSTPKGIKEFMGHLQGRVSPNAIMKLGDMKTKMEAAEASRVMSLSKLGDQERELYTSTQDLVMSAGDGLDKIEDPEARKAERSKRLAEYRGKKTPSGQPLYSDQAIDALDALPPDQFESIYRGSKHAKDLLARAKEEAQLKRLASLQKATEEGTAENWVSKDGDALLRHKNGDVFKIDSGTGEATKLAAMPDGAYKAGGKNPNAVKDADAASLTDDENKYIAEYQQTYGKQIPGIPAGSGAAARQARINYMKAFVKLGKEKGYDGSEAGELALTRDASREAMKSIITKNSNIAAGEKDLEKVAVIIDEELKKLGGPDSPVIRKYWNKASTEWSGDPQFAGLNAAMTNFKETAARVYSNQSGAGGTPVTYLKLAEESIGANPTLEQFSKTREVMGKLFKAREDSNRDALVSLRQSIQMTDKSKKEDTPPAADGGVVEKNTGAQAISSEADAGNELKLAREAYRTATDPAKKEMAGKAVKALEDRMAGKTQFKENDQQKSKSGKPIVFHNGVWEYM